MFPHQSKDTFMRAPWSLRDKCLPCAEKGFKGTVSSTKYKEFSPRSSCMNLTWHMYSLIVSWEKTSHHKASLCEEGDTRQPRWSLFYQPPGMQAMALNRHSLLGRRFCNKASDGEGDGKSAVLGGEMAAFLEKPTASSEKLSVITDEESNAKRWKSHTILIKIHKDSLKL